jgi:hypothetical protein
MELKRRRNASKHGKWEIMVKSLNLAYWQALPSSGFNN